MLENRHIFSVSDLNKITKRILESEEILNNICVRGEISNLSTYSSGHVFFTLKDLNAQITCTMFKTYVSRIAFKPTNGLKVIIQGSVTLYEARGTYQMIVTAMEPDGIGALALQFEQLKNKLQQEGYFDENHKKPLPSMPESIGVVTSPTGAAICDIVNILTRRWPLINIYVYPAIVQGNDAPKSIKDGIIFFNNYKHVDVMIVGRGGGSIEDLWCFNDETLVKTIYSSKIPIISAVGHESDFTLCDFVADKRAPTPSAAAELAVPNGHDIYGILSLRRENMCRIIQSKIDNYKSRVDKYKTSRALSNPMSFILDKQKDFAQLEKDFFDCKDEYFKNKQEDINEVSQKLLLSANRNVDKNRNRLGILAGKLSSLDPLKVVSKGYSVVYNEGNVVKNIKQVKVGDTIKINLCDGVIQSEVKKKSVKKKGKK